MSCEAFAHPLFMHTSMANTRLSNGIIWILFISILHPFPYRNYRKKCYFKRNIFLFYFNASLQRVNHIIERKKNEINARTLVCEFYFPQNDCEHNISFILEHLNLSRCQHDTFGSIWEKRFARNEYICLLKIYL